MDNGVDVVADTFGTDADVFAFVVDSVCVDFAGSNVDVLTAVIVPVAVVVVSLAVVIVAVDWFRILLAVAGNDVVVAFDDDVVVVVADDVW